MSKLWMNLKEDNIYLSPPHMTSLEEEMVLKSLRSGWVAPAGPILEDFESALSIKFGYANVLALNSGTSALHLAVKLAGVSSGDRVVIGTFTFVAAANAVRYEGGIPVFIDSDQVSWNLDPHLLQSYLRRVKDTPNMPRAVIVTHIFGMSACIQEIRKICDEYGIILIEDAAEALGTKTDEGHFAGSIGDYGALSFNGNKILTTGGGGALICKHSKDRERALYWSTQSKSQSDHYLHTELGYNYRMSSVAAALGLAQLERFDEILARKKSIKNYYDEKLSEMDFLEVVDQNHTGQGNHWLTLCQLSNHSVSRLLPLFRAEQIEVRRFWMPLHLQPVFRNFETIEGAVSEKLFNSGICLPSGVGITEEHLDRVVSVFRDA